MPDNNDPRHCNASAATWLTRRFGIPVTDKTLTNCVRSGAVRSRGSISVSGRLSGKAASNTTPNTKR
jgi:hypothetical protein